MYIALVVGKEQAFICLLILILEETYELVSSTLALVRHFQIIYMLCHAHLGPIYDLICNAWAIVIHNKSICLQISS